MARRSPETLADYLVVAISPALIMLLVGSLVFFLVEVFYPGEFRGRLLFVMAMFVMAIVCIARIAMEEGSSYATLYALPLGAVVALAILRFVPGALLIGLPLMAIVWWSAHKLTWDCTLVDDTQDASGQGLLQQMGFVPGDPSATAANAGVTTSGGSEPAASDDDKPWWMRWLEPDRRPHAPGVWVVYFSLAALPIFGIGGWFVPGGDEQLRWRVFRLMAVYVASGLSLLVATSFLGLRRYLRQRRLQMPLEMTATWVVLGGVLIVGMLGLAAILPRPRAEHSLASVPSRLTSAVRNASRFAVGPEGTPDAAPDQQVATTESRDGQQAGRQGDSRQGQGPDDASGGQSKSQPGSSKAQGDSQDEGKSGGKSDGKNRSEGGQSGESSDGKSSGKSESGDSKSGQSKGGASESGKSKSGESEGSDSSSGKSESGKLDAGKSPPSDREPSNRGKAEQARRDDSGQQREPQAEPSPSQSEQGEPRPSAAGSGSPPPPRPRVSEALSSLTNSLGHTLGTLLRWIFYAAVLVTGLVLAWIYREELVVAWHKLLEELQQLFAGWFGGGKKEDEEPAATAVAIPPRPFSAYSDPFLSGAAANMAWPELVRYTFEALEAWAREQGFGRHRDQTPHEFATAIGQEHPELGQQVRALAAWYAQLAYAPRSAASHSADRLRELWQQMASSRPAVAVLTGEDA